MNWGKISKELGGIVSDSLKELAEGAEEDLKAYGEAIANSMIVAVRTGREDLRREVVEQAKLLAETHRIRVAKEANGVLEKILSVAVRVGAAAMA